MSRQIAVVKLVTIVAFMATLSTTYYLRSEVLKLNAIRFSSDNLRAEEEARVQKEQLPARMAEFEIDMQNYDLRKKHYEEMLVLYKSNYEEYIKRVENKFEPPVMPTPPNKPRSPELGNQLAVINAEYRAQQLHYFDTTARLNWVACASGMCLVGGLLTLLMFDKEGPRIGYLAVLALSFVFMIGPSFHTFMSAIVGLMTAPSVY